MCTAIALFVATAAVAALVTLWSILGLSSVWQLLASKFSETEVGMRKLIAMFWNDLQPETQRRCIVGTVVMMVGVLAATVLALHQPSRWSAAVAIGFSISSVSFFTMALMSGSSSSSR